MPMSQESPVSPSIPTRRRRFRSRRNGEKGGGGVVSKLGAIMLMLLALFLVIAGCIFAIKVFE
ncbi:MAG: hypothetical protein JWO89_2733 [Verrucomicrobiaceae bacterium]|nr:hypothetical protein [Verrucomicrobiaceae bacterium]MDB6116277.1 hypothetical protein [Verrucomicrobiaceae bacterium]